MMEECRGVLQPSRCLVYLDDRPCNNLRAPLEFRTRHQYGLKLKHSKCSFLKDHLQYLRHVFSANAIETGLFQRTPRISLPSLEWLVTTGALSSSIPKSQGIYGLMDGHDHPVKKRTNGLKEAAECLLKSRRGSRLTKVRTLSML